MKKRNDVMRGLLLLALCVLLVALAGCGKAVTVVIADQNQETQVEVHVGDTVEKILTEAEIRLGEKDQVTPSLDAKITEENPRITVARYAKATIERDDSTTTVELVGGTVQDALDKAGVRLEDNELLNFALDALVTDGMEIVVKRNLTVTLTADGTSVSCTTSAKTVADFLAEQNVTLGENDRVYPETAERLSDKTEVVVKRVTQEEETVTEPIAYESVTNYSGKMVTGTSTVTQAGVDGEKQVVYLVTYVDGVEESREMLRETVTKEPVQEIITCGTAAAPSAPSNGSQDSGKTVVSREKVDDCDGSGHGYYIITYSDGSVEYVDY